ncbi:MAG: hypothetical protein WBE37_02555 [Bryobacteraceae bacterium]
MRRRARARERIKHRIAGEREQFDEPFSQFDRIWGRMPSPRRRTSQIGPDGTLPSLHFLARKHRERFLNHRRGTIFAALAQKQNVFDIVLDDSAGLVRLAIESSTIALRFSHAVGDFVPQNGHEAIQAQLAHPNLDVCVKRDQVVAPALLARDANVAYDATDPSTAYKNTGTFAPNPIQFVKEVLIILEVTHLAFVAWYVFLESPIRRRCHH